MKKDLLHKIKTKENSVQVLQSLEDLKQSSYKKSKQSLPESLVALDIIPAKGELPSKDIDAFIKQIKQAPIVTVTSATALEDPFIETLYSWFESFGIKSFLLDFHIDSDICGGLLLEYKGVYYDLSVRRKVDTYVRKSI